MAGRAEVLVFRPSPLVISVGGLDLVVIYPQSLVGELAHEAFCCVLVSAVLCLVWLSSTLL